MKRVYANYCVLVSFEVDDDVDDDTVYGMVADQYALRGFDIEDFDDGEYEVIPFDGD